MRSSIAVCVYLMVGGACGSPPEIKFGAVTEDGKAAIRDWCKERLEMESHMGTEKQPLFESPNLLIMDCYNAGEDAAFNSMGRGWLAFDSVTNQFVNVDLELRQSIFDSIVNRVVVPVLDGAEKAGYDELRTFLAKPAGRDKDWTKGKMYMLVEHIVLNPNPDNIEPTWIIKAGYRK